MPTARARRTIVVFLIILTIIVVARVASSAEGSSLPSAPAASAAPDAPRPQDRSGLFSRARVALFDPEGKAAPALGAL